MSGESATILFTDVVGSTELSHRLSPEAADEVRRGHFSILRQAIAEVGGTEVKNLGDGLMVAFGSASTALACAVAMQQGVEHDNRGREYSVGLRVGLSSGEVSREDDDYFGDPVVEAARLCAICETGQILAADVVRLMAGRRNRHECRSFGPRSLKGLPNPLETVEVTWEPIAAAETDTVPLPARLALRPGVGVVGRETELSAITDAVKRVAAGQGREVLLVSGEAGLGKTTLVADAARVAFDDGACVLFGHCEEDLATPYQLFAEAIGHYVIHAPEDQLLAHVEVHGSELARLVPALVSRIRDLPPSKATDSDTERYLLLAAVVGLLAVVSERQPVIVVLDDLQWADEGSLLLLRHLVASEHSMRVLVLGVYRDNDLSQSHALFDTLAALHRQSDVARIELTGLDDNGVLSFMEAAAGQTLDDAGVGLAHAVYRETDGNPFFVSEVLRHLSETGAIYQDVTGRWMTDGSVEQLALPDSVRVVIGARVGRLGQDAGRVLSLAAVIGRDFDLDLLARATRATEDEVLDILEAAIAASLVRELADAPGHYSFAHALIQHTLYEDLSLTRRVRAHRHVAEAMEDIYGDRPGSRVGELARHWFSATRPIDLLKATTYSRQAGDAALAALAPADALRYYAQACDLYQQATDPDPFLGIDLAIGLGTAQRQTGDPAFRDTLLGAARRAADVGDTDRLVAAALANDRGTFSTVDTIDTEKVGMLEMALARISTDRADRALLLSALCSELTIGSPLEQREALADEAIAIAEHNGDDAIMVRVLNHVSIPLAVPPLLDLLSARSADALVRAERVGDPVLLCSAASGRRFAAACAGDITEMDHCLEIKRLLVEQLNQPFLNWVHTIQLATRALIAGDADRAEQLATEALQIGTDSGQPDAFIVFGAQIIMVNLWRGTLGDLITLIRQVIADNPGLPVFVAVLTLAYAESDHKDEAQALLEQFADTDFELPMDTAWLTGMIAYADATIDSGDPLFAGPIYERLAPFADQWLYTDVATSGPVSRSLGGLATILGRYEEADTHFAHSAASSEQAHATFFAAQTDLLWGKMLLKRRSPVDHKKARDLLSKAMSVGVAHGYGNIERRAAEALRLLDA